MTNLPYNSSTCYVTCIEDDAVARSVQAKKQWLCGKPKEVKTPTEYGEFSCFAVCEQDRIICDDQGCSHDDLTSESLNKWVIESATELQGYRSNGHTESTYGIEMGVAMAKAHGSYGAGV